MSRMQAFYRFCDRLSPTKVGKRSPTMRKLALVLCLFAATTAFAQNKTRKDPTWWDKYLFILNNGAISDAGTTSSTASGTNVDVSNECGPQSETYITLNTANPKNLAG